MHLTVGLDRAFGLQMTLRRVSVVDVTEKGQLAWQLREDRRELACLYS